MRKKFLVSLMTLLMLLGISPQALAEVDLSAFYTYTKGSDGGYKVQVETSFKEALNQNVSYKGWQYNTPLPNPAPDGKYNGIPVTDMSFMFDASQTVTTLDLSNFDTSNVTNMKSMFGSCYALQSLNVSNFNTSKVTDMGSMFCYCWALKSLDLTNFRINKGTDVKNMFYECSKKELNNVVCNVKDFGTKRYLTKNDCAVNDPKFSLKSISIDLSLFYIYDDSASGDYWVYGITYDFENILENKKGSITDTDGHTWTYGEPLPNPAPDGEYNRGNGYWKVVSMYRMFAKAALSDYFTAEVLDLSKFDTRNVYNMSEMFKGCVWLKEVNLSSFDTSNVTDMTHMFDMSNQMTSNSDLTSLDLSNFDTSKVTDMNHMFYKCNGLTSLDLSNFNTSKVTNMESMFSYCSNLTSLDLSNFNVSSETNTRYIFTTCGKEVDNKKPICWVTDADVQKKLKSSYLGDKVILELDIELAPQLYTYEEVKTGNEVVGYKLGLSDMLKRYANGTGVEIDSRYWHQSMPLPNPAPSGVHNGKPVTSMKEMFMGVWFPFDLSKFDTRYVTDMSGMFKNSMKMTGYSSLNTSNVTDMSSMFENFRYGNLDLYELDLSKFNTSNVTNMSRMFAGCQYMNTLDISNFDTGNVTDMNNMFSGCSNLTYLDLSKFNTSNVTNMSNMLYSCEKLRSVDLSKFNTSNVTNMSNMLYSCSSLESLNLLSFDTQEVEDMSNMFNGCIGLTKLDLSSFDTQKVENMSNMFSKCTDLNTLDLNGFVFKSNVYIKDMFYKCSKSQGDEAAICYVKDNAVKTFLEGKDGITQRNAAKLEFEIKNGLQLLYTYTYDSENDGYKVSLTEEFKKQVDKASGGSFNKDISWKTGEPLPNPANNGLGNDGIHGDKPVINMSQMFYECSNLESLDLSKFDTRNVTDMSSMFNECSNLKSLDLLKFDTRKVTDMSAIFKDCINLESLDLSKFDTRNVTGMTTMFYDCRKLTSLNLSSFNTSNVTDMSAMFYGCSSLTSLDLSRFNTSNVTDMSNMFRRCSALSTLDLSHFDTSGVSVMAGMFDKCSGLTSLDLSSFEFNIDDVLMMLDMFNNCGIGTDKSICWVKNNDIKELLENKITQMDKIRVEIAPDLTGLYKYEEVETDGEVIGYKVDLSDDFKAAVNKATDGEYKLGNVYTWHTGDPLPNPAIIGKYRGKPVISMAKMFYNCTALTSLDLSKFNTSNITNMESMFNGCSALTSLDLSNFDTSNVTNMKSLFASCSGLKEIDLSNFDTSNVTNMGYLFANCRGLKELDLSNFDTSNVTNMRSLFYFCSGLTELDLSNFDTSNVIDMGGMFYMCSNLSTIDLSNFNTANVTTMNSMFSSCNKLSTLHLSNFNTANIEDMGYMFKGCSALTSLDVSNFNTENVDEMKFMFLECSALASLDLSNFNTSKVTTMEAMFYRCSALTSLDLSNFNTSKVTTMKYMFYGCSALTTLDLSNFDISEIGKGNEPGGSLKGMFEGCGKTDSSTIPALGLAKDDNTASSFNYPEYTGISTANIHFGVKYSTDGLDYALFDDNTDGTAMVLPRAEGYYGNIDIPASVEYISIDAIAPGAFKNCTGIINLDARAIKNGVHASKLAKIGSDAFSGCSRLQSVALGSGITNIGDKAFHDTNSLTEFSISTFEAPNIFETSFDEINYQNTRLIVDEKAVSSYQNHTVWKNFKELHADVDNVASDDIKVTKTADGIRIDGAEEGTVISIITLDGKVVKSAVATDTYIELTDMEPAFHIVRIGDKVIKTTF